MGICSRQGSASLSSTPRTSRLGIAALAAIVVTFLSAAPAMASTVSVGSNNSLSYNATSGQVNQVTISGDSASLTVTEAGTEPITAGNGCTAIDAQTVTCVNATQILVNVRDLDDTVTLSTGLISQVSGRDGADTLNGGSGADTLIGGEGNDALFGNAGEDALAGENGDDQMVGGDGVDLANYALSSGATVDLNNSSAQDTGAGMDTLVGIENVNGSTTGPDHLTGDGGPNTLIGSGGNDEFHVEGGGSDVVNCGTGADSVTLDRSDSLRGTCENVDDGLVPNATITAGPNGPTADPTWHFTSDEPWATFQCAVVEAGASPSGGDWAPCVSPETATGPEGPDLVFFVRAVDDQNSDTPAQFRAFRIDTNAPETEVQGPGGVTTDSTPTFTFSSPDADATGFLCRFDADSFALCSSPYTADPPLADGDHTFEVAATDAAGNFDNTPAKTTFRIESGGPGPGPGDGPAPNPQGTQNPPQVQQAKIIIGSLVLIAGNTVRMSRKGKVPISLTCAGAVNCSGRLSITTAAPVSKRDRRLVTLGTKKFRIGANKKRKVTVRFSKAKIRLAKRLKRFKAKAVIREIDARGNPRISSRIFVLRAR
jgi:hypothetical protein